VEEHSRLGGLCGSIAEWKARQPGELGTLLAFGVEDTFMHEIGSQEYARRRFGLTAENFATHVRTALGRT